MPLTWSQTAVPPLPPTPHTTQKKRHHPLRVMAHKVLSQCHNQLTGYGYGRSSGHSELLTERLKYGQTQGLPEVSKPKVCPNCSEDHHHQPHPIIKEGKHLSSSPNGRPQTSTIPQKCKKRHGQTFQWLCLSVPYQ